MALLHWPTGEITSMTKGKIHTVAFVEAWPGHMVSPMAENRLPKNGSSSIGYFSTSGGFAPPSWYKIMTGRLGQHSPKNISWLRCAVHHVGQISGAKRTNGDLCGFLKKCPAFWWGKGAIPKHRVSVKRTFSFGLPGAFFGVVFCFPFLIYWSGQFSWECRLPLISWFKLACGYQGGHCSPRGMRTRELGVLVGVPGFLQTSCSYFSSTGPRKSVAFKMVSYHGFPTSNVCCSLLVLP